MHRKNQISFNFECPTDNWGARGPSRASQYIFSFETTECTVMYSYTATCIHRSSFRTVGGRSGAWARTRAHTFDSRTIYMAIVRSVHLWTSYMAIVCSVHLWNSCMAIVCSAHLWNSYMEIVCSAHLWNRYMAIVCYMNDKGVAESVGLVRLYMGSCGLRPGCRQGRASRRRFSV